MTLDVMRCYACGQERPVGDFPRDKTKASGRKSICRACDNRKSRRYYEANRDVVLLRMAALRETKPARKCRNCDALATSARHWYCDACRQARRRHKSRVAQERERRASRATATQRGYGVEHKRLRQRWRPIVAAGGVLCARCGELIDPGDPWDLGHDDIDRSTYTGPEHRACNRATAGRARRHSSRAW